MTLAASDIHDPTVSAAIAATLATFHTKMVREPMCMYLRCIDMQRIVCCHNQIGVSLILLSEEYFSSYCYGGCGGALLLKNAG